MTLSIKPENKIAIFYHVGQLGHRWKMLYQEQIQSLFTSGLYDACDFIHVGINGNEKLPFVTDKIKFVYNENKVLEADTLSALWKFSYDNPDYKVLYFHTKGVTQPTFNFNVNGWRLYLEYFTIHKWKENIDLLNECDCVGTEVRTKAILNYGNENQFDINVSHYPGNFWWANSSYIKTLSTDYLYKNNYGKNTERWNSEYWIGTGNPKIYNWYDFDSEVLYYISFPVEQYFYTEKLK